MTAIDFPNTPVNGQVFAAGELTWTYSTGVGWLLNSSTGGGGTDEVWIGATEPSGADLELWYDTDDNSAQQGGLPWNAAWGLVGQSIKTIAQTAPSATTYFDVTNMAVTFSAVAGRLYRATASFAGNASASTMGVNEWNAIRIQQGGATLAGSQQTIQSASSQEAFQTIMPAREFAAGPVTLKVTAYFGGGLGQIIASPEFPCTFTIEDVGPTSRDSGPVASPTMQWNAAWGAITTSISCNVAVTAGPTTLLTQAFTAVAGRRYALRLLNAQTYFTGGAAGNVHELYVNLDGTNTQTLSLSVDVVNNYLQPGTTILDLAPTAGAHTITVTCTRITGVGTLQARFALVVEDVGPVSYSTPIESPFPAWTALPYAANWAAQGTSAPGYRKVGDIAYLQGGVQWNGGAVADGSQLVCTLPVGYRPLQTRRFVCWLNNTGVAKRVSIDTNGSVTIDTPLTNGHSWELAMFWPVMS